MDNHTRPPFAKPLALFLLLAFGLFLIAAIITQVLGITDLNTAQLISSLSFFALPPVLFALWQSPKPLAYLQLQTARLSWKQWGILALVFTGALGAVDLTAQINSALPLPVSWQNFLLAQENYMQGIIQEMLSDTSALGLTMNFITMVLAAAIGEELFFRGVLQKLFVDRWGTTTGIIVASLAFGIGHMQPYTFLPIFIMGIMLGLVKEHTKSLWIPILLHATNNSIALYGSYTEGYDPNAPGLALPYSLALTVLMIIGLRALAKSK